VNAKASERADGFVRLGYICGVHGVKGWIKVHSYTEPRGNIVDYTDWMLERDSRRWQAALEHGKCDGKNVLAKLDGIDDRDAAGDLIGTEIMVARDALPPCGPGEFYWADLEGLEVVTGEGRALGRVDHLLATGANDVLVVRGETEQLIPFVLDSVVREVDLAAGRIVVDWAVDDGEH
jgi:16S rRNA processing protein RimM